VGRFDRSVLRVAATAALMIALGAGLSACGRKGPLDPPPAASAVPQPADIQRDSQGREIAPPGPNRRLPIDVLLD
jgi:predicted small lipoprotein YifL